MKTFEAVKYTLNLPFTVTSRVKVWHVIVAVFLLGLAF
jgi:hypothetical protein